MALPTAYLTSTRNTAAILDAITRAQAPTRFTQKFLEQLGFPSSADRLTINVLKALGLLNDTGVPTQRYFEYLDKSRSKRVLADGIRTAYSDLFQVNTAAQTMSRADVLNKMKTITQGGPSESVLSKMATTFLTLCGLADFTGPVEDRGDDDGHDGRDDSEQFERRDADDEDDISRDRGDGGRRSGGRRNGGGLIDGLVYNINIHLPESRQPEVYDALFRALREHLL